MIGKGLEYSSPSGGGANLPTVRVLAITVFSLGLCGVVFLPLSALPYLNLTPPSSIEAAVRADPWLLTGALVRRAVSFFASAALAYAGGMCAFEGVVRRRPALVLVLALLLVSVTRVVLTTVESVRHFRKPSGSVLSSLAGVGRVVAMPLAEAGPAVVFGALVFVIPASATLRPGSKDESKPAGGGGGPAV